MEQIPPGRYRHFKGKEYEVLGIAHHTETSELLVVYRALYDHPEFGKDALFVRPLTLFVGDVEVEGKMMPRFAYIA